MYILQYRDDYSKNPKWIDWRENEEPSDSCKWELKKNIKLLKKQIHYHSFRYIKRIKMEYTREFHIY
jgi:hypothetical protein